MYYWHHCGLSVSPSVCHSVCEKDCCKNKQLISLKLGVMTGPTNRKKWLPFGGDPLVDTDCGSLFSTSLATARHGILGGLLPFLIQSPSDFHDTRENDWREQGNESTTNSLIQVRITFSWDQTPWWRFALSRITFSWGHTPWWRFALSRYSIVLTGFLFYHAYWQVHMKQVKITYT